MTNQGENDDSIGDEDDTRMFYVDKYHIVSQYTSGTQRFMQCRDNLERTVRL
jgi:hypothetical protein